MKRTNDQLAMPEEIITSKIYLIRETRVMIDEDLAELYGVTTSVLNQSVKRHLNRFPKDFMFQLTKEEFEDWLNQFGPSTWGGRRKNPYVFTEKGVAMLSGILNSERAIKVNIQIMRVFTKLHQMLETHKEILRKLEQLERKDVEQDERILLILNYIRELEQAKEFIKQPPVIKGFKKD
jgi:hypothetical protein